MDFSNISAGVALLISVFGCVFTNLQVVSKIKETNFSQISNILEKLEKAAEDIEQKQQAALNTMRDLKHSVSKTMTDLLDAYAEFGDFLVAYSNYIDKLMIYSSFMPHPRRIMKAYKDECFEMLNVYAIVFNDLKETLSKEETMPKKEVLSMDYPIIASLVQFYKNISFLPGRFTLFGFIRRHFREKSLGWKIYRSFF